MHWELSTALEVLASPRPELHVGTPVDVPVVVVDVDTSNPRAEDEVARGLARLPVVAIATGSATAEAWDLVTDDPAPLATAVEAHPHAAVLAAEVLRANDGSELAEAWQRESAAYAILQASVDHKNWLADQGHRVRTDTAPRVHVTRQIPPGVTVISLCRPRLHNLLDRQMRDELVDAFIVAGDAPDPVIWRAEGPSFCAGGDLAEFGSAADPARSHAVRTSANVAPALAAVASRLTVEVHGAVVGAGIELAALAARIVAHPDSTFTLPELDMGLIPGAGGTVSIPRRIGRQRSLEWLLRGRQVDAATALQWGLIDEVGHAPR